MCLIATTFLRQKFIEQKIVSNMSILDWPLRLSTGRRAGVACAIPGNSSLAIPTQGYTTCNPVNTDLCPSIKWWEGVLKLCNCIYLAIAPGNKPSHVSMNSKVSYIFYIHVPAIIRLSAQTLPLTG